MGGGGGGGGGLSREQLKRLEQKAKEALESAGTPSKCNAFISFVEEDLRDVNLLRAQAKNENSDIEFNDWSVKEPYDSEQAEYIRRGIRERLRQCSVTIVYITERTASSAWVDWEIRESIALKKGVIAMYKGKMPPTRIPNAIAEHKIPLVPWNQKALSDAIKNTSGGR